MSHRIAEPSMTLTARELAMVYQAANLTEVRLKERNHSSAVYWVLHDISQFLTACGNIPRQNPKERDDSSWTVPELSRATRLAERTIRLDLANGELPGTKSSNRWTVTGPDAKTYIERRKKDR